LKVTAALQAGTITQAVANDHIGQAKFFRAIAHHEILIHHVTSRQWIIILIPYRNPYHQKPILT
jgi:hypothetical protein